MANGGFLTQRAEEAYRSPEDLQENRNLSNLGASLIESGMEKMGSAKAGKAVADYLRSEWHRQEANTFQATVGKNVQERIQQNMNTYKQRTKLTQEMGIEGQDPAELRKGYYSEYAPDGVPVSTSFVPIDDPMAVNQHLNTAASDMIGGMQGLSMEYMDAASEYPNNPLIEGKARNLMSHLQATFQGQLEASKIAGDKMKEQDQALDIEKKQEDARIRQLTLPYEEKIAVATGEQQLDTIERSKLQVDAMEANGRELARSAGIDGEALDRDQALRIHYKDVLDTDMAMKKAKVAAEKGSGLLPPGVGPDNIEAFLTMDPRGKGLYLNFERAEENAAMKKNPEVRRMVEQASDELQGNAGVKTPLSYDQLPEVGIKDKDGVVVGKDMVHERVFVDGNTDLAERIKLRTMNEATKYLIGTPLFAMDVGIKPKGGLIGEQTPPIFTNSDEALRVIKPELFTEENEEEYNLKLQDEEYSGDPEDPFGPANEDPESPIAEGAPRREQDEVATWAKWYDEFVGDPAVPLGEKKKQARKAVRVVSHALMNTATRQSLDEYGLPTDEYMKEVKYLQKLRADLFSVINGKEGDPTPDNVWEDISDTWDMASDTIGEVLGLMDANHEKVIKNTERGLRYMGFNPSRKASKVAGGIIDPFGSAVQNREGIIQSGLPYGMASPEEQQARQAIFKKTLESGGIF